MRSRPARVLARFDATEELLTVWDGTQMPHKAKRVIVDTLGFAESQVRVIAPHVGGGFGPKNPFYPEELVVPAAAMLLGAPVKWIEDRRESFTATNHEREQDWDLEVAVDADGRLLAVRGKVHHDHGSATPSGLSTAQNSAHQFPRSLCAAGGAHRLRGVPHQFRAGDVDRAAPGGRRAPTRWSACSTASPSVCRSPREEVRRRNLIGPEQMPYVTEVVTRDGLPMTYDSGDYPESQRRALAAAGWSDFPARQEAARQQGRFIGLGLSNYVEGTGRGPFESVSVRIGPSGKIVVATGATDQGQGTHTMLAQLAAEAFGVPPDRVQVIAGDTAASPLGHGAYASRQAVTAGSALHIASQHGRRQGQAGGVRHARSLRRRSRTGRRRRAGARRARHEEEPRRDRACAERRRRLLAAGRRDARAWRRPTISCRRPSPTPTARMSARSRSIPRPGTSASRAMSSCTTAGA